MAALKMPTPEQRKRFLASRGYSKLEGVMHQGLSAPIDLAYMVHGAADAPHKLLFIQGLGTCGHNGHMFLAQLLQTPVGKTFQVVTMDNRGAGESSSPSGRYTTESLARDWKALAAHLGWERPHVLGISLGGMIAQEYALLAPETVASLVLNVTHAGGFSSFTPWAGALLVAKDMFAAKADTESKVDRSMRILVSKSTLTLADPQSAARRARLRAVLEERVATVGGSGCNGFSGFLSQYLAVAFHRVSNSRFQLLVDAGIPCLVMRGDEDNLVRIGNSEKIAAALGVECVVIPDCGHAFALEQPELVTEKLTGFYCGMDSTLA